ncbi:hypothetical protein CWO85_01725 [Candidatus Phytoplasma ziziphi]|uniref:Uncharacterized protein n=1 Tax=Ziziphus jujuba witches'-broom phytoplasma TaxID=135727 RepID=A0A660HMM9_ZIZJU|nr:hypothetical protein [Candidatus Phytoplasma ziziphi]AYJ01242.1 hypothetical protein CWO85_01725 [Candidatus Phytoplasma ziziphi]
MFKKNKYDLKEITDYLTNNYFRVLLLSNEKGKTNLNLENSVLYLNPSDVPNFNQIFKKISNPPFEIKQDINLNKDFIFDATNKILYSKKIIEKKLTAHEKMVEEETKSLFSNV